MLAQLYTIGHSTHPIEIFLGLLEQHRVSLLADVRSFPSSRRWPQFNQVELQHTVGQAAIAYRWLPLLGGRRHSRRVDSPNMAWEHPAFRAYADYAETTDFTRGLDELMKLAADTRAAIMCSEGLWWRCHRRIIADYLTMRGWTVEHIMPAGALTLHALPEFATPLGDHIVYDGGQRRLRLE